MYCLKPAPCNQKTVEVKYIHRVYRFNQGLFNISMVQSKNLVQSFPSEVLIHPDGSKFRRKRFSNSHFKGCVARSELKKENHKKIKGEIGEMGAFQFQKMMAMVKND